MTNIEKYSEAFCSSFEIEENALKDLVYKGVPLWNSVGHMILIANIEDAFDIMLAPEDITTINTYESGKRILSTKYNIKF